MKQNLLAILASLALACHAFGWIHVEPVDHAKQLAAADFAGIVEVTAITDTGAKKAIFGDQIAFREIKVTLKVLSPFKGDKATQLTCTLYREPTGAELIADGIPRDDLTKTLLNIGTDERVHLFLPKLRANDRLIAYLVKAGDKFVPLTGDAQATQSLLRLEMANQLNTPAK